MSVFYLFFTSHTSRVVIRQRFVCLAAEVRRVSVCVLRVGGSWQRKSSWWEPVLLSGDGVSWKKPIQESPPVCLSLFMSIQPGIQEVFSVWVAVSLYRSIAE